LSNADITKIVGLQLKSVIKMLAKQNITLDATPEAIEYLAQKVTTRNLVRASEKNKQRKS